MRLIFHRTDAVVREKVERSSGKRQPVLVALASHGSRGNKTRRCGHRPPGEGVDFGDEFHRDVIRVASRDGAHNDGQSKQPKESKIELSQPLLHPRGLNVIEEGSTQAELRR